MCLGIGMCVRRAVRDAEVGVVTADPKMVMLALSFLNITRFLIEHNQDFY